MNTQAPIPGAATDGSGNHESAGPSPCFRLRRPATAETVAAHNPALLTVRSQIHNDQIVVSCGDFLGYC
jgi:hypothetical protein